MEKLTQSHCYSLEQDGLTALKEAPSEHAVEEVRIAYLGRQGVITKLIAQLKSLSLDEKKEFGPILNAIKQKIETAVLARKQALLQETIAQEIEKSAHFDVTAYLPHQRHGSLHPYTRIISHIEDVFISMGYAYASAPEVETDHYNFEALNIPQNHPARDMHDTFWLPTPHLLLRTHTSNVQTRTLSTQTPPLAVFSPGRVFRHEATDATHDFMFMQCEGFVIDKNISLAHLCGTLKTFMQKLFNNQNIKIRLRPSYFPFVEPGVEVDISCLFCTNGCTVCKKSGWIELCGAGLIHPNVLRYGGIDPNKYRGFAFGFGIERLAMLRYGINDIRLFHTGKIEFLKQF